MDEQREHGDGPQDQGGFLARLAHAPGFRRFFPKWFRRFGRLFVPHEAYMRQLWRLNDPYADAEEVSTCPARVDGRLGILTEITHSHKNYIGACRDLGVPYRLLDISAPDWVRVIRESDCAGFLVHPPSHLTIWKQMFDERLKVMVGDLGKTIYPSYNELWLYESKRRMAYWLEANDVPHPRTRVFYDLEEALESCRTVDLPIVVKSDLGSGASGVRIFRDRSPLRRFVARCFRTGIVRRDGDPRDRQWGSVLLQEYVPDAREWRVIRLGDSFFAHQKLKMGDFHSGSGLVEWCDPPRRLLDFARETTDKGGFTSMNLDTFETPDGRYFVSELQSVFGSYLPYQMRVNDTPGRYLYDASRREWVFERGEFNKNGSCNLRVETLLRMLGKRLSP